MEVRCPDVEKFHTAEILFPHIGKMEYRVKLMDIFIIIWYGAAERGGIEYLYLCQYTQFIKYKLLIEGGGVV